MPTMTAMTEYFHVSRPRNAAAMPSIPRPIAASPPRLRSRRGRRRRSRFTTMSSGVHASKTSARPIRATTTPMTSGIASMRMFAENDRDHARQVSGPRMGLLVDLFQPLDAGVRVDLGGRDGRVTKELLHCAQIGSRVEQVRRECVTQRVNGQPGVFIDLVEKGADGFLHGAD